MTNEDIDFPDAETGEVASGDRKFENLPQSVQDAIKSSGLFSDRQMSDIAAIVKDGDAKFQTGTEIDREMMRKADRMMDAPMFEKSTGQPGDGSRPQYDVVLQDIFDSAGRDHEIVHDHLTGARGDDGQDFMMDVSTHEWNDDGKAAGGLFEWTKDATSPFAAETANVYAEFLGRESDDLLAIDGNRQIGDMNPELVKAFSNGLMPYQEELITDQPRSTRPSSGSTTSMARWTKKPKDYSLLSTRSPMRRRNGTERHTKKHWTYSDPSLTTQKKRTPTFRRETSGSTTLRLLPNAGRH